MSNFPNLQSLSFSYIFLGLVGLTIMIWVLRGVGLLAFIPSSLIWILLFLSVGTGILNSLLRK